ncbi:nitrite reductase small subunit NirD [Rhodococcus sp. WS1]|jgi:nitrite reductase (NADH) small subunit|uniref:Nitrite reductase small subunit n=3 Tax=Rhodococcus erythropolis group TaxID=2840174 RepID=A0A0C3A992_RHOER|nr:MULTISPECIES: nitrite reductase small subunit NirD [Rhodococcus]MCW0193880.1 nitrite reductase small subunit NirD [Rhodococcus sp. (in: high G+C Gram-positive bacteria)]AGT91979.1 nitrite reductase small subunit [Rhodococcus erythropolis CCM2595]AKD97178.1 nitrite reductase [Rhodococcus erythropolis]ALU71702.1 nitrite reductase [Rhodococcus erythropolis R138]ATI33770.1 nitrite reductase (NAD(P)H) small subunit [Rhodococcus sp. H-CA8f]
MSVIDAQIAKLDSDRLEWTSACPLSHLIPGRGVAVLLRGGEQVALFLLEDGTLRAVSNFDPYGRAAVMSRGLVGDRDGEPIVVSPLLKQAFSLVDGRALDDSAVALPVYGVRVWAGVVQVHSLQMQGVRSTVADAVS